MEHRIEHKSISEIKDFLANHSHQNMGNEICGFIGFNLETKKFIATIEKNEAVDTRSFFSISPVSYLNFKNSCSMLGVFHSHIMGDENPSEFDVKMSEACCLSFIIFSINSQNFSIYEPSIKDYDVKLLDKLKKKLK
jgi:proteasome lid subunit RPN8/RPN11